MRPCWVIPHPNAHTDRQRLLVHDTKFGDNLLQQQEANTLGSEANT